MASKECYLYVQTIPHLLRLNLSDLCESGSSPEFEIAYDYAASDGRVPIGMACIVVGSKIYMVGGENAKKGSMLLDPDRENWFNTTDVYVFDPTKPESEDRLVLVRDGDGAALGRLNGPKCNPIVFTFEGKFYVLSTRPYLGYLADNILPLYKDLDHILPVFEVFDPTLPIPSWKALPHQPNFPSWTYFAWGHKLLPIPPPMRPSFFIFDAKEEKWAEDWEFIGQFDHLGKPTSAPINGGVEFKGLVFAVTLDMNVLVAYDLDACGHLKAHWVLHELDEVFQDTSPFWPADGFLADLGGGRMCFLLSSEDCDLNWIVRVVVFRVDIPKVGDRPVVQREILRTFVLRSWNDNGPLIQSVFMCDHSSDSSEALQSCKDLKKRHAIEYVKGDSSKRPKTTLPE